MQDQYNVRADKGKQDMALCMGITQSLTLVYTYLCGMVFVIEVFVCSCPCPYRSLVVLAVA